MQTKLLISLMTIGLIASVIGVGTYAFFSDTETSTGNSMAAGVLDLKVWDGKVYGDNPSTLVTITDMKPSYDKWSDPTWLKIVENPGKLWKKITNVHCVGGAYPEPEQAVETATDETTPDSNTNWLPYVTEFKMEINDGTPTTAVLLESVRNTWMYLGLFEPNTEIKVEQYFHMVDSAGNVYQGDQCTFDEQFLVTQDNDLNQPA